MFWWHCFARKKRLCYWTRYNLNKKEESSCTLKGKKAIQQPAKNWESERDLLASSSWGFMKPKVSGLPDTKNINEKCTFTFSRKWWKTFGIWRQCDFDSSQLNVSFPLINILDPRLGRPSWLVLNLYICLGITECSTSSSCFLLTCTALAALDVFLAYPSMILIKLFICLKEEDPGCGIMCRFFRPKGCACVLLLSFTFFKSYVLNS